MIGLVHKTTNLINNKIYIGQTTRVNSKIYLSSGDILRSAIKKYGKNNFKKDILGFCSSQEELDECEKVCIEFFESTNPIYGYNLQLGGFGRGKNTEQTRRKMSESAKKRKISIEGRKKLSEAHKGKILTKEHKENISRSNKGKPGPWKGKESPNKGKQLTQEQKDKISNTLKGRPVPWKGKESPLKGTKLGPMPEETKEKLRIINKQKYEERCKLQTSVQ